MDLDNNPLGILSHAPDGPVAWIPRFPRRADWIGALHEIDETQLWIPFAVSGAAVWVFHEDDRHRVVLMWKPFEEIDEFGLAPAWATTGRSPPPQRQNSLDDVREREGECWVVEPSIRQCWCTWKAKTLNYRRVCFSVAHL